MSRTGTKADLGVLDLYKPVHRRMPTEADRLCTMVKARRGITHLDHHDLGVRTLLLQTDHSPRHPWPPRPTSPPCPRAHPACPLVPPLSLLTRPTPRGLSHHGNPRNTNVQRFLNPNPTQSPQPNVQRFLNLNPNQTLQPLDRAPPRKRRRTRRKRWRQTKQRCSSIQLSYPSPRPLDRSPQHHQLRQSPVHHPLPKRHSPHITVPLRNSCSSPTNRSRRGRTIGRRSL